MTIGIAVYGTGAGLAVFRALQGIELIGRGAIGGFASFVAITATDELVRAETQRGGTKTLFTDAETTGVVPPPPIAAAPFAAVMSSGPDRPTPLAQFTPGDPAVGLVAGHRLPNLAGADGVALNVAVLDLMRGGASAEAAATTVLAANPEADAGVIALDRAGGLYAGNTSRVAARSDVGYALVSDPETGNRAAVLHNAIHPAPLAQLAAQLALDAMNPRDRADFEVEVCANTPIVVGAANAVLLNQAGRVVAIEVDREVFLQGRAEGAVIGPTAIVRQGGTVLGRTVTEPYGVVEDGRLVSLSGRTRALIGVRRTRS